MLVANPTLGELVLLGGGHAQVAVLRQFAMSPLPGLRLTLVTPEIRTPYSGMLPGYVEGKWSDRDLHIDLARLAQMANARLILDRATGIDAAARQLHFAARPSVAYDMLSINIGGQPDIDAIAGARGNVIPVKPISQFQQQLDGLFAGPPPRRLAIIGGGAAGGELALALSRRWLSECGQRPQMALFTRSTRLLPQMGDAAAARLATALRAVDCALHLSQPVTHISKKTLTLGDGSNHGFDACFLVSAVAPAALIAGSGLATDERGFIAVTPTLQSRSHPTVFASGDIASLSPEARPKAGIFAVRAGPVLEHNLRQYALGGRLREWWPQRSYLALIGTADGSAIAVRGDHASKSRLWLYLKHWIDRRWMARYTDLQMTMPAAPPRLAGLNGEPDADQSSQAPADPAFAAMRCLGCGAKTGHETLANALQAAAEFAINAGADPALMPDPGLEADSALLPAPPEGAKIVQSVDMLSQIITDPFRLGRIAATHALSDLYAANATPAAALAIVNLAEARIDLQQDQLTQLLAGGITALAAAGVRLVGGHTSEGGDLSIGFATTGWQHHAPAPLALAGPHHLILSKPLGTGVIMAGHMSLRADGAALADAIEVMEQSNQAAAQIFNQQAGGAAWMTDVTGFGLARHAMNLATRAGFSGLAITPSSLPLIAGASDLLATGIRSSLHSQNRAAVRSDDNALSPRQQQQTEIAFDPQTSGGLLAILPASRAGTALASLADTGHQAAIIGHLDATLTGLSFVAEGDV